MNNLKSYTEYAVTTPTTDFVIGFDFNYGTDAVNVTVDGVPATDAGYSVIYLNSTTMQLSPAVPSGVVRLQRETDIDAPDNQFTAGAKFIASNMDENFTQIRHSQQEVRDGFEKLSDDTYEIIDTLQVVGQAAQDAADAAEQAAQTANDAAAQVNDKVSYQDLDNAVAAEVSNSIAVKFLVASEIGLTKWEDFTKPPYTTQQYEQAYSNGVNLAAAIKRANDEGFDKIILERGNYPVCYTATVGSINNTINATAKLHDIYGMEVDFNESTLFVIFDSNTKNPYDLSTLQPWDIGACILETKNVRNITFRNGTLRGDQYNRSWLNGEQQTEQTYGIICKSNSRDIKFKSMTFTGFRGDGVSGEPRGDVLSNLDTWYKGGIDKSSGAEADIAGAYRSLKIDLSGKSVIDNQVQLNTTGYLRRMEMRTDYFDVFFFDTNSNLISYERGLQAGDITLPATCRYIQFVAYEDERTTATVSYGLYIRLYTGSSADFLFDENCHFYENHRGGISNLGSRTTVRKTKFHDIGVSKLGFKKYNYPTNYAVNLEDTYATTLVLDDVDIKNVPQALLAACYICNLVNSKLENTSLTGAGAFAVSDMTISNNKFYNVAGALAIQSNSAAFATKTYKAQGNIFRDCTAYYDISSYPKWITDISGNTFISGRISFIDNGFGNFSNNTIFEPHVPYTDALVLKNMGSAVGNTVHFRKHIAQYSNWARYSINAKNSKGNKFIFLQVLDSRTLEFSENKTYKLNGTAIENGAINLMLTRTSKGWATHVDSAVISDYELINSEFSLQGAVSGAYYNSDIVFDRLNVSGNSSIYLRKNETDIASASTNKIIIKNSNFDLTNATYLFRSFYALKGTCSIEFINCEFVSDVVKSLAFIQGQTANITATATNCRFINVVNTDSILQINGAAKVAYDPPNLANGAQQSTTVALTGAKLGDNINVSFSQPLSGTRMWGEVTSVNIVTVYHRNDTGAVVDLPSGTLTVKLV